jgi:hypothetical protein
MMYIRTTRFVTKPSEFHGVGGFATEYIPRGTVFENDPYDDDPSFRGFNWSDHPNAVPISVGSHDPKMLAIRDIMPGDEVTFPRYSAAGRESMTIARNSYRKALDRSGFSRYKTSLET